MILHQDKFSKQLKKPSSNYSDKLYKSQLSSILSHVNKSHLTFDQLFLICYESNIKLLTPSMSDHLQKIFNTFGGQLPISTCFNYLQLQHCQIIHNHPIFYVSVLEQSHQSTICYSYWKKYMANKYGRPIQWFKVIAQSPNSRKIKYIQFKQKIQQMLKGSPHQNCSQTICYKFPKNSKNQIELKTFREVLRHHHSYHDKNTSHIPSMNIISKQNLRYISQSQQQLALINEKKHLIAMSNNMKKKIKIHTLKKKYQTFLQNHTCIQHDHTLVIPELGINKQQLQVINKLKTNKPYLPHRKIQYQPTFTRASSIAKRTSMTGWKRSIFNDTPSKKSSCTSITFNTGQWDNYVNNSSNETQKIYTKPKNYFAQSAIQVTSPL